MPPQHHHHSLDTDNLLSELQSHNAYFDSLVNMIPARLYVAGASGDDAYNPKYGKGQHKESKEARRARNKIAKRDKFDPNKMETTLETKRRVQLEMEQENHSDEDESDDDEGDDNVIMSDDDGDNDATAHANAKAAQPTSMKSTGSNPDNNNSTTTTTDEPHSYTSRIEMLRAKLHAKMAEKRALAAGMSVEEYAASSTSSKVVGADDGASTTTPSALVSKRAARRAEKRKRQEAAKQRNKKNGHSTVVQGNNINSKQQQQHRKGENTSNKTTPTSSSLHTGNNSPTTTIITAQQDLATIDFQSLAGLKPKLDGALNNKSLVGVTGGGQSKKKSLEKLLADAERKQARLRELKASGSEEDKEKARNIEWGETLKVAGGTNVRKTNDPKLLKNALKRKAKKKAASAKAWNVRLDQAKDASTKKQQIRMHNIDARKLGGATGANLSSKRIVEQQDENKKEKRRRLGPHSGQGQNRAGFEGRKSGFINGGGGKEASNHGGGGGKK